MADLPRPRKNPSEWAAFPPAGETPAQSVEDTQPLAVPPDDEQPDDTEQPAGQQRYVSDTQPLAVPVYSADLPRPRREPSEWAAFPPDDEQPDDTEQPAGRQRYSSDTQPLSIPPEAYRGAYEDEPEYGSGYTSDMGIPDGYDPYDPPRRRRKGSTRSASRPPQKSSRSAEAPARAGRKKHRRRHTFLGGLLRMVLTLAVVVFAVYSAIALALISKLECVPRAPRTVTSGTLGNANYTRSILLIGTDSRDIRQERGRSDTMILLTFNDASHEIYLSSFLRDTYVEIPNRGFDRLNAAYSYGGAELLMDTLEANFDVSIDDYVCVSFAGFANIIDAVGGVELHLTDEEAEAINEILRNEVNELMGDAQSDGLLNAGGDLLLTGKQALSYARIRYLGNGDFERTARQRALLEKLEESMKQRAVQAVPQLLSSAKPSISTNMNKLELYKISLRLPAAFFYDMQQQQIPADGTWTAATAGGMAVLQTDTAANRNILRSTAFSISKGDE